MHQTDDIPNLILRYRIPFLMKNSIGDVRHAYEPMEVTHLIGVFLFLSRIFGGGLKSQTNDSFNSAY